MRIIHVMADGTERASLEGFVVTAEQNEKVYDELKQILRRKNHVEK